MRSSASIASILTLFALGAATGCGGTDTNTSAGGGGSGGSTTSSTAGTGGMTGGAGGMTGGGGAGGGTGGVTGGTGGMTGGSGGGGPTFEVVDCDVPDFNPPADPNATCEVTMPGTAGVLLQGTVLTSDKVIHKGQVLVGADGKIACVDCDCSGAAGADQATVVTCAQGVISPALINPHDHITFDQNKPIGANTPIGEGGHGTERYEHRHQWRKGQDGHMKLTAPSTQDDAQIRATELRFVLGGATTAAAAGGRSGLLRNVDVNGMGEGITFAVDSQTFPLADSAGTTDDNLADGCDYGAAPDTAADAAAGDAYLPHISEGISVEAHNEFICTSNTPPPGGAHNLLGPKTSIIHAIGLTAEDVGLMRIDTTRLIWSPRSNVDLYGNTANVTMFDTLGVPIALGTDWLPTGSMNMLRELRCADELNTTFYGGHFNDFQLWRMATVNAALAIGQSSKLGDLKVGLFGDISVFNGKTKSDHRAIVGADSDGVVLVMRGGKILYGDEAIVDDLRPMCEQLDVCGIPKRACVAADVGAGVTLNTLVSAAQISYPLFFCPSAGDPDGTPQNEPSCIPYRAQYPNGPSPTDKDGDNVPDATDNCPNIFNPTRPMDAADPTMPKPDEQADFDGDGKGDVCDPCPIDAQNGCSINDIDGDGKPNDMDNCPKDKNADQADMDQDGKGDLCDPCPDKANPGAMPCPAGEVTIKAIRDPNDPNHPAVGASVLVKGAYVTGVDNTGAGRGFFIQDTSLMPLTGIFVFTAGNAPNVVVGNKVDVQGTYAEYFQLSEIDTPTVTVVDPGTTLPFMPIDIANPATIATGGAQAEAYESMLVKIGAVSVSVANPDLPSNFDEFVVSPGNLRIDDQCFDPLTNTCIVGKQFTGFTGVLTWTFSNSKILPRSAADIGLVDAADPNYCKPYP